MHSDKSYGRRAGMDEESKQLLKRDLFVQGLLLKWQEKFCHPQLQRLQMSSSRLVL